MNAPEDDPRDEQEIDRDEYDEWERLFHSEPMPITINGNPLICLACNGTLFKGSDFKRNPDGTQSQTFVCATCPKK